jgi:hypothetical protein
MGSNRISQNRNLKLSRNNLVLHPTPQTRIQTFRLSQMFYFRFSRPESPVEQQVKNQVWDQIALIEQKSQVSRNNQARFPTSRPLTAQQCIALVLCRRNGPPHLITSLFCERFQLRSVNAQTLRFFSLDHPLLLGPEWGGRFFRTSAPPWSSLQSGSCRRVYKRSATCQVSPIDPARFSGSRRGALWVALRQSWNPLLRPVVNVMIIRFYFYLVGAGSILL